MQIGIIIILLHDIVHVLHMYVVGRGLPTLVRNNHYYGRNSLFVTTCTVVSLIRGRAKVDVVSKNGQFK